LSAHNTELNISGGRITLEKLSRYLMYISIGIAAGLLSGLFGIGGGTIIVPALVLWAGMSQRLAAGTSVTAILPTAIVGSLTYNLSGNVDWVAAGCLAVGIVVGAQLGSVLLARLSSSVLQWGFIAFLMVTIISLWFVVPQREQALQLTWITAMLLVVTGVCAGVLSGVMGLGGGIIVVPALIFFFGSNDLSAKGTSLTMMVPGSISATIGNLVRRNLDVRAACFVGIGACISAPLGVLTAGLITPLMSNVLFSMYLVIICAQMTVTAWRQRKI